jgi:acyl-CoA reductase-like NAD-dependent aldehyde dehydrogenase
MSPKVEAATAMAQLESFNPATGESIGAVPQTRPDAVQAVVDTVAKVQPFWAQLTLADRARYLERAAQVLIDDSDAIRDLIVREQGKPRNEAFSMEVLPTIDALHWIARAGQDILADEKIPMSQLFFKTKSSVFTYEPLGVIGVIAPWNYPWSIPFGEVALALMAGNGVVLKPASLTPLIGERIAQVLERAGVPEGLVRVVHGPGTGAALVESGVAKVFFTGSVETGRGVGESCARQLKGSVLELGGKDPMLVLGDVKLDHAVAGALWGGFANAGQTCSGIERAYVLREHQAPRVGALRRPQRLVAPVRRDARQGAARDRGDPLRPPVDPCRRHPRRGHSAAEADRASAGRRDQALSGASGRPPWPSSPGPARPPPRPPQGPGGNRRSHLRNSGNVSCVRVVVRTTGNPERV